MTRPFQFRLERVRALRESAEEQAQEELANSLAIRLKGEAMLRAAAENVSGARDEARRRNSSTDLSGSDLIAVQAYMERAERARESAALELDRREAEVDARRAALTQRSQERQVLERLKERRAEDHRVETERREGAQLDEMALSMHRRAGAAL
ncbi:MAG: flagellar protein FliJ [Thermoleophilaceae bacterium]|nr:flagellar protein FliJ [Thermoleophilaceae bacterium]